jgi:hypothetical protein
MKVGIITHHYIKNFGAFLQVFALQEYLKSTYPDAEVVIINYVNRKHKIINIGGFFRFFIGKESLRSYFEKIKLLRTFIKAERRYLDITSRVHSSGQINALGLDCIIIGSDEVWHYESNANDPVKFAVGLKADRIFSYAPSSGSVDLNHPIPEFVNEGLLNFTSISARDDTSEKLVERVLGYSPVRVLDPTLIYDFPVYEDEFTKKLKQEDYVLMYHCEKMPKEAVVRILSYCKLNKFKLYGAGEYAKYYSDMTINLSPFQWVEMFRNAKFVFTGTFHGAVFSLMTEKNFAAYLSPANPSRAKKVHSLLGQFGLSERIFGEGDLPKIDILFASHIDYTVVNAKKSIVRSASYKFLKDAIE